MALDDIRNSILEEARKNADNYYSEGLKKVEAVKNEWIEKIENRKNELMKSAEKKINQKIQQVQFRNQTKHNAQVIQEKYAKIDKVYDLAMQQLVSQSTEEQLSFLIKIINKLPDGEGEIIPSDSSKDLLRKAIEKSNKSLLISDNSFESKGGFIYKSKQIEMNYSFENIIHELRQQTETEVIQKLFNEQK